MLNKISDPLLNNVKEDNVLVKYKVFKITSCIKVVFHTFALESKINF